MSRSLRIAAAYIAFFAMLMHGLMPVGWMPGAAQGAPITICTMDGLMQMAPAHDSGKQKSSADKHGSDFCPFGAAAHFATPTKTAAAPFPTLVGDMRVVEISRASQHARAIYSSQSPRAPPFSA